MRMTPPIYAKGTYVLISPWVIPDTQMYTCIAIRSLQEFTEEGVDPYAVYYQPMGITQTVYNANVTEGACIVTLISEDKQVVIHVPDTFILSFPDTDYINYADIMLQIKLNKIPEGLDLTSIMADIHDYVAAHVGNYTGATVDNTTIVDSVQIAVFPVAEKISIAQSVAMENARNANITDQDTWYTRYTKAQADLTEARAQVDSLLQVLEDNGWTSP